VLNLLHRLVDGKAITPPSIDAPQALMLTNEVGTPDLPMVNLRLLAKGPWGLGCPAGKCTSS
jgi:hypothetical protein